VVDEDGKPHTFNGDAISKVRHLCVQCKAPLMEKAKLCPWCAIETHHEENAAERNPMRILAHFDMLDDYYARAERVRRRLEK
jgi:hypothetical protein